MRRVMVVVLVFFAVAPASADEPSGATDYTDLSTLTAELNAESVFYEAAANGSGLLALPGADFAARLDGRILRADFFIGGVRSRAHDTLHALLPDDVVHLVQETSETDRAASVIDRLEASSLPSTSIWAAERLVDDWISFQRAVARLRAIVNPMAPVRVCPVDGDTSFRDEWQYPRPGGRVHMGTDLHAERGTPLVAVENGVVVQANWHRQGGRQVWLRADSTGDVYYYAHLDGWPRWLWTGTRLEAGDFLGWAGSSGNAVTPHLHFGWMPGSDDVDLENLHNPYALLYELCQ